jgi:hypothetical protein
MFVLAQVETATKATEALATHYGPLAFGVVVLIVVVVLLIVAWVKVGMPSLQMVIKISDNLSNATGNIKATTEGQERMSASLATSLQRADEQHARMERLLSSIKGEDE